ncbi:MAG: flagellar motor switch protein FliM [Nitrospirota bacterium]
MAEKILSQDEVDALLKGVASGEVATEQPQGPTDGTRPYDLTSQERIIRGRMPSLEIVNERFARLFQASLSAALRRQVEFTAVSVQATKFGEFMKKIPLPSNINIVKVDPLKGHVVVVFDATLVYLLIDFFFGGTGQTHVKTEGRDFTPIQQRFIARVLDLFLGDLEKAWAPLHPVRVTLARSEINPQFAMVVVPTELVLKVTFRLEIEGEGQNMSRDVFFCLPYPTIEPIRDKLYSGFSTDQFDVDKSWTVRFREQIEHCTTTVSAELGSVMLNVNDVGRLAVGDVVVLDRGVNDELPVSVEGRPKFLGKIGTHRGKPAVQISRVMTEAQEDHNGE